MSPAARRDCVSCLIGECDMSFWLFMLACDLLMPALMIIAGRFLWKHPPKDINSVLGYRTSRSMKNQDTWTFAQTYCGKRWWYIGLAMLVPSVTVLIPLLASEENLIAYVGVIILTVQMTILVVSIFLTEIASKKNFDREGNKIA